MVQLQNFKKKNLSDFQNWHNWQVYKWNWTLTHSSRTKIFNWVFFSM